MKKIRKNPRIRPLRARYHEADSHIHDTRHEAGSILHDTRHEADSHIHDTRHEADSHVHDTGHEADSHVHDTRHEADSHVHDTRYNSGPDLHDTQHFLRGKEHGNTHLVEGEIKFENDEIKSPGAAEHKQHHTNYSIVLNNEEGKIIDKNSSYFYRGYEQYTQRGYLTMKPIKDPEGNEVSKDEVYLLFHNDKRHQTYKGEENRRVYFQVRNASLILNSHILKIPLACNFDVVPHQPVFPGIHNFVCHNGGELQVDENSFKVDPSTKGDVKINNKHLINPVNIVTADIASMNTVTVKIENFNIQSKNSEPHWGYIRLNRDIEPKRDIILFVSNQPIGELNDVKEFEIRTVPILLAGNVMELDIAYFK